MHFTEQKYVEFVIGQLEFDEVDINQSDSEIWMDGVTDDGQDRTAVISITKTKSNSFTLSLLMKTDKRELFSQITWDYYDALSLGQLALLSKMMIEHMKEGHGHIVGGNDEVNNKGH